MPSEVFGPSGAAPARLARRVPVLLDLARARRRSVWATGFAGDFGIIALSGPAPGKAR